MVLSCFHPPPPVPSVIPFLSTAVRNGSDFFSFSTRDRSPFTAYSQQTSLQPGYLSPLNVRFKREIKFILFIHSTRPPCPSFLSLRLPPYLVPFSSTSSSTIRGMKTRRREVVRRGMEAEGRRLPGDASWVELVPGHSSGGPFKLLAKMT